MYTISLAVVMMLGLPNNFVTAEIALTDMEEKCLRYTGQLFEGNDKLIAARHNFATAMQMERTTLKTMTAKYTDNDLATFTTACTSEGGTIHSIKIDFFDCTLKKMNKEVELTLKNFANCLAAVDECASFNQENLLEEAWEVLGLHCELEASPTYPSTPNDDSIVPTGKNNPVVLDDDLARQEERDAANGADAVDKVEKAAEYTPKEEQGKQKRKRKGGRRFSLFLFVCLLGAAAYYIYNRRLRAQRLPWGGVTTSRFQSQGPPMMFHTNYNLVSGDEEFNFDAGNERQLSSNLVA
jgi:hypothetical protein